MRIWIFNDYAMLPEHGPMNRSYNFGKFLKLAGHEPRVYVGSHPHNTGLQLIEGNKKYEEFQIKPFPWVLIKTLNYEGKRLNRIFSMLAFYKNGKKAAKVYSDEKPDAIIGSSAHPLSAVLAIKLGKKYKCKAIAEVRDLWPESIVAYGIARKNNPIVKLLRRLEKWIYTKADCIVFTMEGAYDYIIEQGWEREIPREKVHFINNGIDLEEFGYNREHYRIEDADLENPDIFKVVYTGSIRKVNNLGVLLDAAKAVTDPRIRFLIWGVGYELEMLKQRVSGEKIKNVIFKGSVEKKYVPYIVSCADLNILPGETNPLYRFGISPNKMFDYFAAEKPQLVTFEAKYNPAEDYMAGTMLSNGSPQKIADEVQRYATMGQKEYGEYCKNARLAAEHYNFSSLTEALIKIIKGN